MAWPGTYIIEQTQTPDILTDLCIIIITYFGDNILVLIILPWATFCSADFNLKFVPSCLLWTFKIIACWSDLEAKLKIFTPIYQDKRCCPLKKIYLEDSRRTSTKSTGRSVLVSWTWTSRQLKQSLLRSGRSSLTSIRWSIVAIWDSSKIRVCVIYCNVISIF